MAQIDDLNQAEIESIKSYRDGRSDPDKRFPKKENILLPIKVMNVSSSLEAFSIYLEPNTKSVELFSSN